MSRPGNPVIELCNVSTTYEGATFPVIRDISFSIQPGEFAVISGPNGSGKTTLLETMVGLLPIIKGTLSICGLNPRKTGTAVRREVGYVIQNFDFHPYSPFTVEEVVMMGRLGKIGLFKRRSAVDCKRVNDAIHMLGLAPFKAHEIGKLSGGQQQKVLIAQNLAKEPGALLLDEPFSNLDVTARDEVSEIFHTISLSGIPVILVTHAFDSLPDREIRTILMRNGCITHNMLCRPHEMGTLIRSSSLEN